MLVDSDSVLKLIPQKYPMVMVDGLISNNEDSTTSTLYLKKSNIFCSDGYFREPGLIENIAQTAALRSGYESLENNEEPIVGYIGSVKRMNIYKLPKDNDILKTKIIIINRLMNVLIILGKVMVNKEVVAEGEMNIFFTTKTN